MDNRPPLQTLICADDKREQGYAIGKASNMAKLVGEVYWVFSLDGFLYMTNKYPEHFEIVAKCWPGGRKELKRLRG